jgi:hypothetical protein
MRKHNQKRDRAAGTPLLLAALVIASVHCSCVKEDTTGCNAEPLLRVTVSIVAQGVPAVDALGDTLAGDITLHSFDATGLLLDTRQTVTGRLERLPAGTTRAVALAGIPVTNAREFSSPLVKGISRLADGNVRLLPGTPATWYGLDLHAFPDDLFWGSVAIPAPVPGAAAAVVDLPVARVVAGVHARLTNARAYLAAVTGLPPGDIVASDIDVIIGTTCNTIDLEGNLTFSRAAADPVNYRFPGVFAATGDRFDVPASPAAVSTATLPRLLVLGAPSPGLPFSARLYHRGVEVAGSPLPVTSTTGLVNGKLNVIDVVFPSGAGAITVTVTTMGWEEAPPTGKPF